MKPPMPLALLLAVAVTLHAQDRFAWQSSIAALAETQTLDIVSSYRQPEANGILRGSNGEFEASKGIALKSAFVVGTAALQWALARKHPKLYRWFAVANYGASVFTGTVVVSNLRRR